MGKTRLALTNIPAHGLNFACLQAAVGCAGRIWPKFDDSARKNRGVQECNSVNRRKFVLRVYVHVDLHLQQLVAQI